MTVDEVLRLCLYTQLKLIIGNRRNKNKLTYQNRQDDDENFRSFSSVVLRPLKLIAYCRNKNKRNYSLSLLQPPPPPR